MNPEDKAKFNERMKQMVAVLGAAVLDNGGTLRVSAQRHKEVMDLISAGWAVGFQFSDDGRTVQVTKEPPQA